jgi:hypothetical protein
MTMGRSGKGEGRRLVNLRAKIGRRSFVGVVLVMGSVLMGALISFEGVALATATSGDVYKLTTGPYGSTYVDNCLKATITTGADNIADIYSFSDKEPSRCDGSYAYSMPGGYLGIDASGYKNGAYCGSTGYYYNSGPTSGIGVGSKICSNPFGLQTFYTVATGEVWDYYYTYWHYAYTGTVASPNQNY